MILGVSCAGPGVGLDKPCESLPSQDTLQFCDHYRSGLGSFILQKTARVSEIKCKSYKFRKGGKCMG